MTVSYVKNNRCVYVYVNKCMSEKKQTELEKRTKLEFLFVFFTFINFFMKAFIQENNLLSGCAFGPFTYVFCENSSMSCFSVFLFLTFV